MQSFAIQNDGSRETDRTTENRRRDGSPSKIPREFASAIPPRVCVKRYDEQSQGMLNKLESVQVMSSAASPCVSERKILTITETNMEIKPEYQSGNDVSRLPTA
jgi:hypothetical protein